MALVALYADRQGVWVRCGEPVLLDYPNGARAAMMPLDGEVHYRQGKHRQTILPAECTELCTALHWRGAHIEAAAVCCAMSVAMSEDLAAEDWN